MQNALIHTSPVNRSGVAAVRADFPILARTVHDRPNRPGRPLVYLDSAASAQKPRQVIDAISGFYEADYANVHRGLHYLSGRATQLYEAARETVRGFINAGSEREIVFTRSATEAINLVASSYGRAFLQEGDEIILTDMEHHANIVPWQMVREATGAVLKVVPVPEDGSFDLAAFEALVGPRTKLVALTHCSNVLGTVVPAADITRIAHDRGVPVLFDGSQAVVHMPVDVRAIGADFYAFTGHKLYGPTGIGVLYGKEDLLDRMPPFQGGGDMIRTVTFDETTYADLPAKFEAGTPPIAQAIGLAAAIDYVESIGRDAIAAHEHELLRYATDRLAAIPGLEIIGRAEDKAAIVSFSMDCAHPHDIGTLVDQRGVAVRAGHHCAQPLMNRYGVSATTRASFGLYNTMAEVDVLADALDSVRSLFA